MWYPRFIGIYWLLGLFLLVPTIRVAEAIQSPKSPPPPPGASPSPPAFSEWKTPQVPKEGSLEQLRDFIRETKRLNPSTQQEYLEMQRAIREAALKILQGSPTKDTDEFKDAEFEYVSSSVMLLGNENEEAPRRTFERFREYLKAKKKLIVSDVQMCLLAGQNMEQLPDRELVREAYSSFADIVESKEDESLASFTEIFRASLRRLDLPGTELKWKATTLTGEEFSLESLRGNIVVIYLFTTTSLPSIRECEGLAALQMKYRDKQVRFVGVSLDSDKSALEGFLTKQKLKWTIIWDAATPGTNPLATEYGVLVLPTTILVDQAGIVQGIEAGTRTVENAIDGLLKPVEPEPVEPGPNPEAR